MAQVLIAIGFTYCSRIALGQSSIISAQTAQMRHRAQATHDAAHAQRVGNGLRRPKRFGTSKSVTVQGS